jgi:hypothetical protein
VATSNRKPPLRILICPLFGHGRPD